ncbi:MAG: hypothetical protein FJ387_06280 [Verrucomicrobia bacterium]|nr:hypothetical protein [Verrucomicrobiota bacterium]
MNPELNHEYIPAAATTANCHRDLDMVKVTVLFKDANGGVICEADFCPVLVSEFSLAPCRPLKAGSGTPVSSIVVPSVLVVVGRCQRDRGAICFPFSVG